MNRPTENLSASRYEFAFDVLQSLASSLPSRTVLDIGAGDGRMKKIESLGLAWHGFDLNPSSPDISRWDLTDACPEKEPPAGAALLLDVLEHCTNPGIALKNIAATLQIDGRLILTMPNPRWSRSRVDALLSGYPTCFTQGDLDANHHVFTPWPHILQKMLGDAGFEIDNYVTLDGKTRVFDRPVSLSYPLRCLFSLGLIAIERLDPSACGMSYGLIARRVS